MPNLSPSVASPSGRGHSDLSRLRRSRTRDADCEHAIAGFGRNLHGIESFAKLETTTIVSHSIFVPQHPPWQWSTCDWCMERQDSVVVTDVDLLWLRTWEIGHEGDLTTGVADIDIG